MGAQHVGQIIPHVIGYVGAVDVITRNLGGNMPVASKNLEGTAKTVPAFDRQKRTGNKITVKKYGLIRAGGAIKGTLVELVAQRVFNKMPRHLVAPRHEGAYD